jgi:hypothetical protein
MGLTFDTTSPGTANQDSGPRSGIQSCCSGLQVQGTAGSPPSTTLSAAIIAQKRSGLRPPGDRSPVEHGGDERDRTVDLLVANEALSQLSYIPTVLPAARRRPSQSDSVRRQRPATFRPGHPRPVTFWRRERDSNPRYGFPYTRFPTVLLQPLGHLSAVVLEPGGVPGDSPIPPRCVSNVAEREGFEPSKGFHP